MSKTSLVLALLCLAAAAQAEISEPVRWSYRYMLATADDFRDLGPVAKHLADDKSIGTPDMLDLMAELLATRQPSGSKEDLGRADLIRAMAAAYDPRYFAVLRNIANEKTDSESRKAARKALDRKKVPTVEQFKAGMSSVMTLRDEYAKAALAVTPTDDAARHFRDLPMKSTLDAVFAWAGRPQAVSARYKKRGIGQFERLALYYRGIGRVEMQLGGDTWYARRVVVAPLAFEDFMPYRLDPAKYGQPSDEVLAITQLVSDDRGAIRLMLDRSEQYDKASLELLDTAAERLFREYALFSPPLTRDLYDWMCVLLTHEGGSRYAGVLATIASTTKDEKIRSFASEKIDETKNAGAPPYVPGTLSLEAQRAKYPSLYPERTFYYNKP